MSTGSVCMNETAIDADLPIEPAADTAVEPAVTFDFDAAVDRYQTPLLRYAMTTLGRRGAEAEDVVQETFLRLYRQIAAKGPHSIDDMTVWLYRVAHNVAMDFGRRRSVRDRTKQGAAEEQAHGHDGRHDSDSGSGAGGADGHAPLAGLIQNEALAAAMAEVDKLPDVLRQTIELKILHGMTMKQIAKTMDTTASNVHYRLHQALSTLSTRLKEHGPN
ncbi:sigma-70 family RNA polymerase sigma factor [Planctomycetales bacterium ZRK34]|nr:sigma-70 family RNA polymerase sigma factor [Planctomycetales bacterium ZRK34]